MRHVLVEHCFKKALVDLTTEPRSPANRRCPSSDVSEHYPQIIEAGRQRYWTWVAHGKTNSILHADMTLENERSFLKEVVETIAKAVGQRPRGWMGPGLTETFETPTILKELGLSYVLDWCADDQPFPLNVPGMISVPYAIELNDINLFVAKSLSGDDFYRAVVDQFDQLYEDSTQSGRVMALALHPFVIGQPPPQVSCQGTRIHCIARGRLADDE